MKLNEEQLKAVAGWFAGGASLDEIQKRIAADFGLHITYFDLRMLVADLPQPQEPEPSKPEEPQTPAEPDDQENPDASENPEVPADSEAPESTEAGGVSVSVDTITIPGTMASGDVTFSDGVKGKWYLDQMGRLGLGGDLPKGFRPSPEDAALFQSRLMEALQAKGLC